MSSPEYTYAIIGKYITQEQLADYLILWNINGSFF